MVLDAEIETFAGNDAGSSKTYPIRAGEVKKGMLVMLKEHFPCKVVEVTTSKTGKHGHAKAKIVGTDIFTGKKYIGVHPTSHNIEAPFVTTETYILCDIEDDFCSLMDEEGNMIDESIGLPGLGDHPSDEDVTLREEIVKNFEDDNEVQVIVTRALGKTQISAYKISIN